MLVKPNAGINQTFAADHGAALDEIGHSRFGIGINQARARWHTPPVHHLKSTDILVDKVKVQFRGLPQQGFQALRVVKTGHLHQNTGGALPLNGWLGRAQFVNAAADNFNRLLQGAGVARQNRFFGNQQIKRLSIHRLDIQIDRLIKTAKHICHDRLCKTGKHFARQFHITRVTNGYRHAIANAAQTGISDLATAQCLANIGHHFFNALLLNDASIHFQQQVRAALQIKPQIKLTTGQKPGQGQARALRHKIRSRKQKAQKNSQPDADDFEIGKMQHNAR